MFSRGIDVVLEQSHVIPVIRIDSLSEGTKVVENVKFPVIFGSAKWAMVFKLQYI